MQLGMIGLGRMGANMVRRLIKNGHDCVVFDRSQQAVSASGQRERGWRSFSCGPCKNLDKPRAVWLMVPGGSCRPDHR